MQYDKLGVCNDCLIATGNDPVTVPDGSDAWIAVSTAYDRCLPRILYSHNWPFQTQIIDLTRLGDSKVPGYTDAYEKPASCLHLEAVWRTDMVQFVPQVSSFAIDGSGASPFPLDYDVVGDEINTTAPNGAQAKIVKAPPANAPNAWPEGFVEALRRAIESLLYQGLNEDLESALEVGKVAELKLGEAKASVDRELPRKVAFVSRMLQRRRTRNLGAWW